MCPNLAKFLLGPDNIWLKFAIEYLYSFFLFWRSKIYEPIGQGGGWGGGGTHGRGGEAIRCYRRDEMVSNVLRSIIHVVRLTRDCLSGLVCCYARFARCLQLFESPRAVVENDDLRIYYLYNRLHTLQVCNSSKTQKQNGPQYPRPTKNGSAMGEVRTLGRRAWTCRFRSGDKERERERETASGK